MILVDCHNRRDKPLTFRRGDHNRFTALHHCRDRVGRAKIDANDFCHKFCTPLKCKGTTQTSTSETFSGFAAPLRIIYCATLTNAGRMTRSPSMYPFWTTPMTEPLFAPSAGSC